MRTYNISVYSAECPSVLPYVTRTERTLLTIGSSTGIYRAFCQRTISRRAQQHQRPPPAASSHMDRRPSSYAFMGGDGRPSRVPQRSTRPGGGGLDRGGRGGVGSPDHRPASVYPLSPGWAATSRRPCCDLTLSHVVWSLCR